MLFTFQSASQKPKNITIMKTLFIISSILLLSFTSCKKIVTEVNPDFIGSWEGDGDGGYYSIIIEEDGYAEYYKFNGITEVNVNGKAKIKNDKLKILTKKFTITEFPTADPTAGSPNRYRMVLDDVTYWSWK